MADQPDPMPGVVLRRVSDPERPDYGLLRQTMLCAADPDHFLILSKPRSGDGKYYPREQVSRVAKRAGWHVSTRGLHVCPICIANRRQPAKPANSGSQMAEQLMRLVNPDPEPQPVRARIAPHAQGTALTLAQEEDRKRRLEQALRLVIEGAIFKRLGPPQKGENPKSVMLVTNADLVRQEREAIITLINAARKGQI